MSFKVKMAVLSAFFLGGFNLLTAQTPPAGRGGAPRAPGAPQSAPGGGGGANRTPVFDQAAVDRGQQTFQATCGFCHGANAKGGEGGPDLIRSVLVLDDENGKQIGDLLKTGRLDQGMPKFDLTPPQVSDIATFLHQRIAGAAYRNTYQILNILVGDAKAGEAFFNGAGCKNCHSVTGDLKGIGAKYDVATLQGRAIMPRGRGGPPGGPPTPDQERLAPKATVTTPSGQTFSGTLVRLTDFDVTLKEANGAMRTLARTSDNVPKIEIKDPLQAHLDLLPKLKDSDIHNLTAYLVTLK